jgi:hypothetical protein
MEGLLSSCILLEKIKLQKGKIILAGRSSCQCLVKRKLWIEGGHDTLIFVTPGNNGLNIFRIKKQQFVKMEFYAW